MNLSSLYSEICKTPLLTKETERALLDIYFSDDSSSAEKVKAKENLLASHRRFAFNEAKKRSNNDIEQFEELFNAGCEGLLVGLHKFDNSKDMRFLTYAGWWVLQRQLKAMAEFRLVSLPTQKQQLSVKIKRFAEELGRDPSLVELYAEFPDSNQRDLKELSQTQFLTFAFDNVNETDIPIIEGLNTTEQVMLIDRMYEIIGEFGEKDADIIQRLYGLTEEGKAQSYATIQSAYPGVSRQYLKSLKEKALEVLQERMSD